MTTILLRTRALGDIIWRPKGARTRVFSKTVGPVASTITLSAIRKWLGSFAVVMSVGSTDPLTTLRAPLAHVTAIGAGKLSVLASSSVAGRVRGSQIGPSTPQVK